MPNNVIAFVYFLLVLFSIDFIWFIRTYFYSLYNFLSLNVDLVLLISYTSLIEVRIVSVYEEYLLKVSSFLKKL